MGFRSVFQEIKLGRELRGLTQTELSKKSGVSVPMIQLIEAKRANPSLGVLAPLLEALDLNFILRADFTPRAVLASYLGLTASKKASKHIVRMGRKQFLGWLELARVAYDPISRNNEIFNAIALCVKELEPSLFKHLKIEVEKPDPQTLKLKNKIVSQVEELLA